MLTFPCRFLREDNTCGKKITDCGYKVLADGKEKFGKCGCVMNPDKMYTCKYYEYPKNIILLDEIESINYVKFDTGNYEYAKVRETIAHNPKTKNKERAIVYPNIEKEIIYTILDSFSKYKEFYIIAGTNYIKLLMKFNIWLQKNKLFQVGDIEQPTKIYRIINSCNNCAFCSVCNKYVTIKHVHDKEIGIKKVCCSECGNVKLRRKLFARQLDKCTNCGSKKFDINKEWTVQYFIVKKSAFML